MTSRIPTLRHLAVILALAGAAPACLAAQQRERPERPERAERPEPRERSERGEDVTRIDTTFAFSAGGSIDLTQLSGNITVTAWNRREVRVNAYTEYGYLRADLSSTRVSLEVRSRRSRMGESEFRLSVPVGTRIIARSVSGDVTVTGVKAAVEARSVSGGIHVDDAAERITLESVSGDVAATQLVGTVRAQSVSGDVKLLGLAGDLDVESVSGEISLRDAKSANVRAETVSGSVEYRGTIDKGGRYEFKSHSGDIDLAMPEGVGATFSVSTFSGSVDSSIPMTLQPSEDMAPKRRSKSMEFSIGGGGARITVRTFSGDITIEKAGARPKRKED